MAIEGCYNILSNFFSPHHVGESSRIHIDHRVLNIASGQIDAMLDKETGRLDKIVDCLIHITISGLGRERSIAVK